MSFPPDVLLPADSRYYYYRNNNTYNSNYDIVWSMKYQLSGDVTKQLGIVSFITPATNTLSVIPGHYLCTQSQAQSGNNIISLKTTSSSFTARPLNVVSVAIDSTGYYALSTNIRSGIGASALSSKSLIVRDYYNNIIHNSQLSSSGFAFTTQPQTIRYRYSNAAQTLTVDYRDGDDMEYTNIASISLPFRIINNSNTDNIATGFTFCSPISTSSTNQFVNMIINNYHVEGTSNNTAVNTITSAPI